MTNEPPDDARFDFSRRAFLGNSGLAGGAMLLAGQAADVARGEQRKRQQADDDAGVDEEGLKYLDVDEARVVQAMASRIVPSDEYGPGAVEAGVLYFIDHQLDSEWGAGDKWYMEPPFVNRYEGAIPNQGWQSNLVPREVYRFAVEWIEEYTSEEYDSSFIELSAEQQDEVLLAVQENEVDTFQSIKPQEFFTLFRRNVLEGMYCDPMYEGNREMVGWKLKRFPGSPGALGSYKQLIDRGEFIRIPPRSVEDDVESVGIETGASEGGNQDQSQGAVHNHDHGPRYEFEGENPDDVHGDVEEDTDA
ncbi:gluconate 2-dehydrogenase subunit 3 family protein [Halomicrococcus sp. NG-SE-24]|uniref:gluconate 2-dehydrogenase subunit 3 family protein n=1 Tax=Halomicrococcus sp. NG-SE-24 TaxID=3436928 RepID=UPI003D992F89